MACLILAPRLGAWQAIPEREAKGPKGHKGHKGPKRSKGPRGQAPGKLWHDLLTRCSRFLPFMGWKPMPPAKPHPPWAGAAFGEESGLFRGVLGYGDLIQGQFAIRVLVHLFEHVLSACGILLVFGRSFEFFG